MIHRKIIILDTMFVVKDREDFLGIIGAIMILPTASLEYTKNMF